MIPGTEQRGLGVRSRLFLRWTRSFLFLLGALAVSYVCLMLLQARNYQEVANSTLEQRMQEEEQRKEIM